ncbi:MAG: 2-oxoacid:acceptor oxidoreductase family protein, partial [Planctomycetota bacterium]
MNTTATQARPKEATAVRPIVNDMSVQIATVNGTGSQSANLIFAKTIFRMGIPVGPKNLFPSNIAGLPTWFTVRVNKRGYVARKKEIDVLVAMNEETFQDDVRGLPAGSVLIYNSDMKVTKLGIARDDLILYPVPFTTLATDAVDTAKMRKLMTNIVYVGVLAELLGLDREVLNGAVRDQFKGKAKAVDLNLKCLQAGIDYTKQNLPKKDPFRVEPMNLTHGKIMIEGNVAGALGLVMGGCTVLAWYPITPSSSLCEAAIEFFEEFRTSADGKARYAVLQAEDELASIGMVLGAGWVGARAATATAGPGISLMSEFAGLGYYAEVPAVIVDVQRVGPSTGLPTRTAQGDILKTYYLSHGDTKHICVIPASPKEAYEFAQLALDLAERFQTPVFDMHDLDLGMNLWMSEPLPYPEKGFDRGKVLREEDLQKLGKFERYADVDGDGIPYRTLPGTRHPLAPFFTRGSGHNERGAYTEKPEDYARVMDRIARKIETAKAHVPQPIVQEVPGAKVGLIAYG